MSARELESRYRQSPAHAASADDDLLGLKPEPGRGDDSVWVGEADRANMFVDGYAQSIDPLALGNMGIHIVDDLAHPRKQPPIIQHRLAHGDAVLTQLSGVADQPGGLGQSPHRNWAVVGSHAAKCAASCQHGARTQVGSTQGGEHTRRSTADNDDVCHVRLVLRSVNHRP